MMKSSLDHLPEQKQRELARIVQILLEELEDALKEGSAEFKKMGRILKIILFGSYARGDWVDEPHTMKGIPLRLRPAHYRQQQEADGFRYLLVQGNRPTIA
ncbi:hypothetical protein SAMN05518861_11696 [Mesorhizobium sp. YR577]|nr:hypothetical protein SAMN05518861_11696 [Mesorhizobium sp. YR577]